MHVELNPVRIFRKYKCRFDAARIKRLADGYELNGFRRIYHYHSRKTAGTSIAKMFLELSGNDGGQMFDKLAAQSDRQLIHNDLIYVGWDKMLIESGEYYFGFSHIPFDDLNLPTGTFRFTSLREPSERVLSHYRMLLDFSKHENPHSSFAEEKEWLGAGFEDFLDRVPLQHLQNQLFMFSKRFDVEEAVENIAGLDHCIFMKQFNAGLMKLAERTQANLKIRHDRKGRSHFEISDYSLSRLREMLEPEYRMYDAVKKIQEFS